MGRKATNKGTVAAKNATSSAAEATRETLKTSNTVEVPTEQVMLDDKTSLANAEPELAGQTVTPEIPDMNDPEAAAEQAKMKQEYENQQRTAFAASSSVDGSETTGDEAASDEKDAEIAELRAMVQSLQKQMTEQSGATKVVQVMADTEKVTLRFQSECADDNIIMFGPNGMYGQVTGKSGTLLVPKAEWSRFMTEQVRYLMDTRQLIILSGLDDDEMAMYGCDYKDGELLDRNAFMKLLDMGDELIELFPNLCKTHREMIAKRFLTAYEQGDARAQNRDLVVKLNQISKEIDGYPSGDPRSRGLFAVIIDEMNEKDAE